MPRGRKRKRIEFVPQDWIHNTSSEDEDHGRQVLEPHIHEDGKSIFNYLLLLIILYYFKKKKYVSVILIFLYS